MHLPGVPICVLPVCGGITCLGVRRGSTDSTFTSTVQDQSPFTYFYCHFPMKPCLRRPRVPLRRLWRSPLRSGALSRFLPRPDRLLRLGGLRLSGYNSISSAPVALPLVLQYADSETDKDSPDFQQQEKMSNLGSMIDDLKEVVPQLLSRSFPKEMVLPDVLLRICPSHLDLINSYLPTIKGRVSYYATCKALQMFFTSWVLNPRVKLHIQLIRTSHFPEANCVYSHSTKIYIRWSTCSDGCTHLLEPEPDRLDDSEQVSRSTSTSKATLGSHRWSGIDTEKFTESEHPGGWSLSASLADLTKGIIGLKQEDIRLERIILGVFVFELSEDNTEILVHTVEDMNVVEHEQDVPVHLKLRVC